MECFAAFFVMFSLRVMGSVALKVLLLPDEPHANRN